MTTIRTCTAKDLEDMDITGLKYDEQPVLNNLRVLQTLGVQLPPETQFQLLKEAKGKANSSVSQGVAVRLTLEETKYPFNIINYGGGGAKYQQYAPRFESGEVIGYTITEAKPGDSDANFHERPVLEARADLEKRLATIGWKDCLVHAFITGPKRNAWEQASAAETLERDAETLFQGLAVPAVGRSYYLPQVQEAQLEFLAVKTLWKLEGRDVHASLGVGRSTAQMGCEAGECCIQHGMSSPIKLWEAPKEIARLAVDIRAKVIGDREPRDTCIALKSGFLLPEVEPELQRVLRELYASRK